MSAQQESDRDAARPARARPASAQQESDRDAARPARARPAGALQESDRDAARPARARPAGALQESGRGAGTRQRILRSAVALASTEGLEALTIGRLAAAQSLSKAGLFGHFGSKEELQLATLEAAGVEFTEQVVLPAASLEAGLPRLLGLLERWFGHADRNPGGCFFASVAAEFDARRGPVHDRVAHLIGQWWHLLTQLIEEAQRLGQLCSETPARELCLELYGIELASNLARQLLGDVDAMRVGHARARARLLREASASGRAKVEPSDAVSGRPAKRARTRGAGTERKPRRDRRG